MPKTAIARKRSNTKAKVSLLVRQLGDHNGVGNKSSMENPSKRSSRPPSRLGLDQSVVAAAEKKKTTAATSRSKARKVVVAKPSKRKDTSSAKQPKSNPLPREKRDEEAKTKEQPVVTTPKRPTSRKLPLSGELRRLGDHLVAGIKYALSPSKRPRPSTSMPPDDVPTATTMPDFPTPSPKSMAAMADCLSSKKPKTPTKTPNKKQAVAAKTKPTPKKKLTKRPPAKKQPVAIKTKAPKKKKPISAELKRLGSHLGVGNKTAMENPGKRSSRRPNRM